MKSTIKILAFADLHGSQYRLNIVIKNVENYSPDLVVVCGDITQFGPGDIAKNFLDQIPVDTFAVHGNIDIENVLKNIDRSKAKNIHLKRIKKKGIPFIFSSFKDLGALKNIFGPYNGSNRERIKASNIYHRIEIFFSSILS